MPKHNVTPNLPGFTVTKVSGTSRVIICAKVHRKRRCPHCHSFRLRLKASFCREVKHESIGYRNFLLQFKAHKFFCRTCHGYFNQQFLGTLK